MCTVVSQNKVRMSLIKKSTSTTESSSASSSGTSSSSSSSSASDSGSSSSDSDSSSSQDGIGRTTANNSTTNPTNNSTTNPVTPINPNSQVKPIEKNVSRRSSETTSVKVPVKTEIEKNGSTKSKEKTMPTNSNPKPSQPKTSKNIMYSSDDDPPPRPIPPPKTAPKNSNHNNDVGNKRKATAVLGKASAALGKATSVLVKSKSSTSSTSTSTSASVSASTSASASASTGGKVPPSIVKQSKLTNNKNNASNKTNHNQKPIVVEKAIPSGASKLKKKSIFSPDNSSDSDDDMPHHKNTKIISVTKAISGSTKIGAARGKGKENTSNALIKSKPKVVEKEKISVKISESSASSSSSNLTSTSESESESSVDSSPPTKKGLPKKTSQKPSNTAKTDTSKDNVCSESETEIKPKTSVIRKLTRSSSTRKSRHLTGKAASESDSDAESIKRSLSKSPVKKAPVATKGKAKNKRTEVKIDNSIKTPPIPEERKCPIEGCDSVGHLGGQSEKHFTIEACPLYHNMSLTETKEYLHDRKRREDDKRKIASVNTDPSKKVMEQRQYLQKIKDIRAKFKPCPASQNINRTDKDKEPSLNGIVCDYDLQLFREAQAIASENIENELKGLPSTKGTKYISMGKFCMEVWYQSPYPEDAARLPKLYICEFCLRYQKSEVGMKRHSAKCVWRHPPGDEIYRKGKLGVWQVDGKRHKQYCQHLCLLAKFFLDHKTLYYDVEPFLFYVMTLADSEGSHTVGYFSKEKNSFLNYNVSCILTLPPYQRKGYGRLLIDFSYLLTRVEGKIGSPEKPLSDLGLISYRSYWKDVLLDYLCSRTGTTLSIKDVSQEMAINSYDIVSTLQALGMMKYWKGKHIILKKQDVLEEYAERVKRRGTVLKIDRSCLRWTPFVPPVQTGPS